MQKGVAGIKKAMMVGAFSSGHHAAPAPAVASHQGLAAVAKRATDRTKAITAAGKEAAERLVAAEGRRADGRFVAKMSPLFAYNKQAWSTEAVTLRADRLSTASVWRCSMLRETETLGRIGVQRFGSTNGSGRQSAGCPDSCSRLPPRPGDFERSWSASTLAATVNPRPYSPPGGSSSPGAKTALSRSQSGLFRPIGTGRPATR